MSSNRVETIIVFKHLRFYNTIVGTSQQRMSVYGASATTTNIRSGDNCSASSTKSDCAPEVLGSIVPNWETSKPSMDEDWTSLTTSNWWAIRSSLDEVSSIDSDIDSSWENWVEPDVLPLLYSECSPSDWTVALDTCISVHIEVVVEHGKDEGKKVDENQKQK